MLLPPVRIQASSGDQSAVPSMSMDSANRRRPVPSADMIARCRFPPLPSTTATRLPSRDTAGGSNNGPSAPLLTSNACPSWNRQSPSPVPAADRKNKDVPPKRGASARAVVTGCRWTSRSSACRSRIGTVQRLAVGLAIVATTRRPLRLAATDEYVSRPEFTRRVTLRSVSRVHSHGPEPSSARAVYSSVRASSGVRNVTAVFWCVSCSGDPPDGRTRHTSIWSVQFNPRTNPRAK